jgi:tripartite-type tricarboxylate transporter receptor subunit TctC
MVVAKNRPGAGSLTLTNEMYATLPKDGTSIATVGRGIPMEPLFENKRARFDPRKFNWIGSMNNEVSICAAWHTTPVKTFADLKSRGMIVGGTAKGSDTDTFPTALNNVLGTKMKLITGYPGGNDINFAVERGELEGRCGWSWSSVIGTRAAWLSEKKISILVQMSTAKHPDLPDVPLVMDFAGNDKERRVLALIFSRQMWGRPFFTTPGVPKARVAALRKAFDDTMKDKAFLAEAVKMKHEIQPVSGETLETALADIYKSPREVVLAAKHATEDTSKTQMGKASVRVATVKARIVEVADGGREVRFEAGGKADKTGLSGSRTKITVAGKSAKRNALKPGMSCEITVKGAEASSIVCP